jgi:hypothetical protein
MSEKHLTVFVYRVKKLPQAAAHAHIRVLASPSLRHSTFYASLVVLSLMKVGRGREAGIISACDVNVSLMPSITVFPGDEAGSATVPCGSFAYA